MDVLSTVIDIPIWLFVCFVLIGVMAGALVVLASVLVAGRGGASKAADRAAVKHKGTTGRRSQVPAAVTETTPAKSAGMAVFQPTKFDDGTHGVVFEIKRTPDYSVLQINERAYRFKASTGEFDRMVDVHPVSGGVG